MGHYLDDNAKRRVRNAKSLEAFGVDLGDSFSERYRTIRKGEGPTIYTVGYERRSGDDLISALVDAQIEVLVDVRQKPFSRKPDFRKVALATLCDESGIRYETWTRLGSTQHQRESLRETGDYTRFYRLFRDLMKRGRKNEIRALADLSATATIALICYERAHDECHRSVVAELAAELCDASVVAIT